MSEANALTPLSEADYEAIAAAVMETPRGRWFMAEFAKRNRQADTAQILAALGKLQSALNLKSAAISTVTSADDIIAMTKELRTEIAGNGAWTGPDTLPRRIEIAAGTLADAAETIQEAAWALRETGAAEPWCDQIDSGTSAIQSAMVTIDRALMAVHRINHMIGSLDICLRGLDEGPSPVSIHETPPPAPSLAKALPGRESSKPTPKSDTFCPRTDAVAACTASPAGLNAIQTLDDDLIFAEVAEEAVAVSAIASAEPDATASEAELLNLDGLSAEEKLAYFA